jgi:hypothetical protein
MSGNLPDVSITPVCVKTVVRLRFVSLDRLNLEPSNQRVSGTVFLGYTRISYRRARKMTALVQGGHRLNGVDQRTGGGGGVPELAQGVQPSIEA